ncbi:MFS transporter [Streptomyces qinglanensis]|uniref:Predicted arabinose efflux permease, MFS family n=1 Tax=Streptomyces qinglanensis TaxID=943816 RepID=A0A1H9T4I8_9ACTN|nr:MFS transporter [Streptomyces qinglanensis]SER91493.1 Predicted arabinose efflux permease, MFS family [Streptomyces qinglanensis]
MTERSRRPLAGVLAAMAVSLTGTRISAIALPWFVLVTTGSTARTGLVALCEMAPYVLVKAFTGPLVDRIGPRTVSWITDVVSAAAIAAVGLLHLVDVLSFWLLLLLVAVIGAARGPGDLSKEIMVPVAAERARVPLERAAGLAGVTERLASTVGPAAGGAVVALLGAQTALFAIACCFAAGSVVIVLLLPGRRATAPAGSGTEPRAAPEDGYWQRLGAGFRFLRRDPLLLTVIAMVGVTNLLDAAFATLLLPVWARESGNGPGAIGLANSALGIAAVLGSLLAAAVAHRMRRRPVFFAGFLLAGAPRFLILAVDVPLWAVLAVFALGGFGAGFLNPILGALNFERVPGELRGRVNALGDSLAWAGIPLGGLLAGTAVASFGLVPVLCVGAAAYFLTTNLTGLRPEWREMDRKPPRPLSSGEEPAHAGAGAAPDGRDTAAEPGPSGDLTSVRP